MKYPLPAANYSFNATTGTITFSGTIPTSISNIMHITNITRGVLYFQPQAGPLFTGTYSSPILTLAASTAGHSNSDSLLIVYDDGVATLPTGAATSANQTTANTSLSNIDGKLPTLSSGRVPVEIGAQSLVNVEVSNDSGNPIPVSGPLTDTQLRASAVPVSPNVSRGSGAIDSNTQRVTLATDEPAASALTSIDNKTPALVSGRQPVDGSGVTQPISAASLPLPTGAATSGNQTTANTSLSSIDGKLPTLSSGRVPVDTAVSSRTPTTSSVASSASSVSILASNSNRKGLSVSNQSTATLYLSFSSPATVANSFISMPAGSFLLFDQQLIVTNSITGIWSAANGTAQVTEYV